MKNKNQLNMGCNCNKNQVCQFCAEVEESENDVKADIIDYLQKLPRSKVTEVETTGRKKGNKWVKAKESEGVGRADLFWCYFGFYIEIEVKKKGGKHRDEQKERKVEVESAMGEYWLVDCLDDVISNVKFFNLRFENSTKTHIKE
jgi:hypothetical protein